MVEAWDTAKQIMKFANPVSFLVMEGVEKATQSMNNAATGSMQQLQEEAAKQQIQMQVAQHQARLAQELAIARRIENADEVEIEEFYDTSGKGNIGVNVDANAKTASLGVGAEGHHVTKRVYHFKGWRSGLEEVYSQNLEG